MDAWYKKVAIVTDCDDVGVCIIEALSRAGMVAIGFARTDKTVEAVTDKLKHNNKGDNLTGKIVLFKCDISSVNELKETIEKINISYGGVDVLVNNAYCDENCNLSCGKIEDFKALIDININSLIFCTRLVAGSMIERKSRGHIININDLLAYNLPEKSKKNVYIATKSAMTSINEVLRYEFRFLKANIKITNVACGCIESEEEFNTDQPKLNVNDVAKIVLSILDTPEHLHIHEILLDSVHN